MPDKSGVDLLEEARSRIKEVSAADALQDADDVVFLDVREINEWNLGHIPGAQFLARGNLETKVEALIPRDKKVVIYCASGNRSALAADTMQNMGYTNVSSMAGGIRAWSDAGGPID